eukprot:Skav210639  [mRNA]  locus=scaffold336:36175:40055:+ [translate_table: standard]
MEGSAQRFVQSLRAQGLTEDEVRHELKTYGYKSGRINQLLESTAKVEASKPVDTFLKDLEEELERLDPQQVMAEWAAEARGDEEIRAGPGILEPAGLPRLRGKQPPSGGWEHVFIPPWAVMVLEKLAEAEAAARADAASAGVDGNTTDEGPTEPEEPPKKKPAVATWQRTCPGRSAKEPCIFSQADGRLGRASMLSKGKSQCLFCDAAAMKEAVTKAHGKRHITRALRAWMAGGREDIAEKVLVLLPEEAQTASRAALRRPSRAAAAVKARAASKLQEKENKLKEALEHRRHLGAPRSEQEARVYRKKMADDKRRLCSKFQPLLDGGHQLAVALGSKDGKRKRYVKEKEAAAQFYHGRGTVHLHLLIWLQHIEAVKLEESVSATVPADNEVLASLVEGSQRSWTGSGWPKEHGPSHFDEATGQLHLHHAETDYCKYKSDGTPEGICAYLTDILSSLRCHVDVQMSDGRLMILKYVSGYVPKFSDSFTTDWLCDQGSDYAIAKRVLTDYHPLVPEMTLQLAMQWFPQCFAGGTLQRFRVPVPWESAWPERVMQYMKCSWRPEDMTLAEFLRKTGKSGKVHPKLQQRYRQAKKEAEAAGGELLEESVEAWAVQARSEGEVALAAMYLSRYNDRYYGQWVLMNVPFRNFNQEMKLPGLDLVPDHLYFQALAYLHRPEHWTNPAAIRRALELEGFRDYHIQNILAMILANQGMIKKYLDGTLNKNDDVPEPAEEHTAEQGSAGMQLALEQQRVADDIVANAKAGVEQRQDGGQRESWPGTAASERECLEGRGAGRCRSLCRGGQPSDSHGRARPCRQWQDHGRAQSHPRCCGP